MIREWRLIMKELSVLYVTDEKFVPITGVSVTSLFENNPPEKIALTVYILTTNMSKKSRERFSELAEKYRQSIKIVNVGEQLKKIEKLNLSKYRGSAMTNLRLCFDKFIPQYVEKLLYLDADTIICGSIEELADFDMHGKMLGMAYDAYGEIIADKEHEGEAYYNAGVILFDCVKWRKGMWRKRIIRYINHNGAQFAHPDQDIYNILCKSNIVKLPIAYNFQPVHRMYKDKNYYRYLGKNKYYTLSEIEKGRENPAILHMVRVFGRNPWHKNNNHPFESQYKSYKEISYWKNYPEEKKKRGLAIDIEVVLERILPERMFFWVSLKAISVCVRK